MEITVTFREEDFKALLLFLAYTTAARSHGLDLSGAYSTLDERAQELDIPRPGRSDYKDPDPGRWVSIHRILNTFPKKLAIELLSGERIMIELNSVKGYRQNGVEVPQACLFEPEAENEILVEAQKADRIEASLAE